MQWILITIGAVVAFFLFFHILQWFSDRTYKPTAQDIRNIFQDTIDGKLSTGRCDEFCCVRIAYDKGLDEIRERYERILEEAGNCKWEDASETNQTPLAEQGKEKVRQLMKELDRWAT